MINKKQNILTNYQNEINSLHSNEGLDYIPEISYGLRAAKYAYGGVDYLFPNDSLSVGVPAPLITRTSLAHKIIFDTATESVKILAHGLDPNIFDIDYVVNAFSNFVGRKISQGVEPEEPCVMLLVNRGEKQANGSIKQSKVYAEAEKLQAKYGNKIMEIAFLNQEYSCDSLIFPEIKDGAMSLETKDKFSIQELSSFTVFGNGYRVRHGRLPNNQASLNFGDSVGANQLKNLFVHLNTNAVIKRGID